MLFRSIMPNVHTRRSLTSVLRISRCRFWCLGRANIKIIARAICKYRAYIRRYYISSRHLCNPAQQIVGIYLSDLSALHTILVEYTPPFVENRLLFRRSGRSSLDNPLNGSRSGKGERDIRSSWPLRNKTMSNRLRRHIFTLYSKDRRNARDLQ
jgi:hypothetical protein